MVVGKIRQDDRNDQILIITVLEHNGLKFPIEKQSRIRQVRELQQCPV